MSNENSEDESNSENYFDPCLCDPCLCDLDKARVKQLANTLNVTIIELLDSNPAFSTFIEQQLLSFRQDLSHFIRRLFDAKRQNAIKVAQKD